MARFELAEGPLKQALLRLRQAFTAVGLFSFVSNLLLLAPAIYMLQAYDRVLSSRNVGTLMALTALLIGLLALEGALEFVRSRVLHRASAALDQELDTRIFHRMFSDAVANRPSVVRTMTDLGYLRQFLSGKGLLVLYDAPWVPIYLVVAFMLNPWLGLFGLVSTALLVGLAWFNEQATADLHQQTTKLGAEVVQYTQDGLRHAEVAQAMGMLGGIQSRWWSRQQEHLAATERAADRTAQFACASRVVRQVLQSGILGVGAYLVLQDQLTVGGMSAASILLGRALMPLDQLIGTWKQIVAARGAYERLNQQLGDEAPAVQRVSLPRPAGKIDVEGLVMPAAGRREPILKGLNFQLPAGQVLVVMGLSGSGKSTLARALVGLGASLDGCVRLDGADLSKWHRDEVGQWIGYLPQDVELFEGTVAENIARLGALDSGAIVRAAQLAGVHELILQLPDGYETRLGREGLTLSGGQRQRIALARALYGSPSLIVLDEPNAHLDESGDHALLAAIQSCRAAGSTVIVVSHRRHLLALADQVMVLQDGRIQGLGPCPQPLKATQHLASVRLADGVEAERVKEGCVA